MKKNTKYIISLIQKIAILIVIFSLMSCKKKTQQDYRDLYIGNYSFIASTYITTEEDSTYFDTSWNYNGSITKSEYSDGIYIQYFSSLKLYAGLEDNGIVNNNGSTSILYGKFEGFNKIKFIFRIKGFSNISNTTTDSVIGIRR